MKICCLSFLLSFCLIAVSSGQTSLSEETKINEIQVLGSHNSYRLATYEPIMRFWKQTRHLFSKIFVSKALSYSHAESFDEQLGKFGLRSLELDIYYDPHGNLFSRRLGNKLIKENPRVDIPELQRPGFKVLHLPDFDYCTQYFTFADALQSVKKWSDQNPDHFPLYIMIEAKDLHAMKYLRPGYCTKILPFTKNAVDSIDLEIKSVFGDSLKNIFTPDLLRGSYANLHEAVQADNWPTIKRARGKIFFVLYASEKVVQRYLDGHPSLERRCMFVFSKPGNPETAFVKLERPEKQWKEIRKLIRQHYMIRTRSDANTKEAQKNNYNRFRCAVDSYAQIISTDYYLPENNFHISFPENMIGKWSQLFSGDREVYLPAGK